MTTFNPDILRWARETAGLSIKEASQKLGFRDSKRMSAYDHLTALESGDIIPTRSILIKMAKQYHRPLVVFYMSTPPRIGNRGQDFRTLPNGLSPRSDALVDALIRNVQSRHNIIRAELEDEEDVELLSFVKSMKISDGVPALVDSIKRQLKFDMAKFRMKTSPQDAFAYLRSCAESVGVFVLLIGDLGSHHTSVGLDLFRGFAIADEIAPFVVINDKDSKAAWSFTLIHELVHIWLGQTGISNINCENSIEQFCNDVASEFLLQKEELNELSVNKSIDFNELQLQISNFADKRNVSCSMVAYKLYRVGLISKETWVHLSQIYQKLWYENKKNQRIKTREKNGGPNYYVVRRYLLGSNLISTVKRLIAEGTISTTKAGKLLDVKAKNVHKLIEPNLVSKVGRIS